MQLKYDKLLEKVRQADVVDKTSAPVRKQNGSISVVGGILWYYSGGHRYKLTATLDDPGTAGQPIGLLLSLTYAS